MLDRLPDFFLIVNPLPPDAVITQRRAAIEAILTEMEENPNLFLSVAEIAAIGIQSQPNGPVEEGAKFLVSAIQAQQASFSTDIAANALDLRVTAGIATGEHISRQGDATSAGVVLSAIAARPLPDESKLATLLKSLIDSARAALGKLAKEARSRGEVAVGTVQGAALAAALESINKELAAFVAHLSATHRADREELDILWWLQGAYSPSAKSKLASLETPQRAIAVGSDLAALVLLPPTEATGEFALAAIGEDRNISLRDAMESCSEALLRSVADRARAVEDIVRDHPPLLPLTWLALRRLESQRSPGWEAEFERKTRIAPTERRLASAWAMQTMYEGVAARMLAEDKVVT